MTICIFGGTGFLGKRFTLYALEHTDWKIKVTSHSGKDFPVSKEYESRVTFVTADVLKQASVTTVLEDVDVAYYFVHMMGQKHGDFYALELQAANTFKSAVEHSSLQRLVYMGGLGSDKDQLSKHLASRHRTGRILRSVDIDVIEFQASMIIGRGSVGFDIIANLVDKLPVMPLPGSANTLTQPILLKDTLEYLRLAATVKLNGDEVVQIGGPEVMSYKDIYQAYATLSSKHRYVFRVPLLPAWIEATFLDTFTPRVHARIGRAMVESLGNEMIVTNNRARELFPSVTPSRIEQTLDDLS